MQNIKVIMGYIEVTKTTGMVGPLRNAKIKKIQAIPLASPLSKP